jgi:ATP-dependent Lon protease
LAYTSIGGSALLVETTLFPGTGQLKLTGKLGDVMRESVNTCISWIQFNSSHLGILDETGNANFLDSDVDAEQMRNQKIMQKTF